MSLSVGKLRKHKAYGLVGVIGAFFLMVAAPVSANEVTPEQPAIEVVETATVSVVTNEAAPVEITDQTPVEASVPSEVVVTPAVEVVDPLPVINADNQAPVDTTTPVAITEGDRPAAVLKEVNQTPGENAASRWSSVSYHIDKSAGEKPSDWVVPDQLYVAPPAPRQTNPGETTLIDTTATWEQHVTYSDGKVVELTLPNVTMANKDMAKITRWTEEQVADYQLSGTRNELANQLTGYSTGTVLARDTKHAFALNSHISDQLFAQVKAKKLRADDAYKWFQTNNKVTANRTNLYDEIGTFYNRLVRAYDADRIEGYKPSVTIDPTHGMPQEKINQFNQFIDNLPHKIRTTINEVVISGKHNTASYGLNPGFAGFATNDRKITLSANQDITDVLAHEIGHSLDFLSRFSRGGKDYSFSYDKEFLDIFNDGVTFKNADPYYRSAPHEGFAESYGAYLLVKYGGFTEDAAYKGINPEKLAPYFDKLLNETAFTKVDRVVKKEVPKVTLTHTKPTGTIPNTSTRTIKAPARVVTRKPSYNLLATPKKEIKIVQKKLVKPLTQPSKKEIKIIQKKVVRPLTQPAKKAIKIVQKKPSYTLKLAAKPTIKILQSKPRYSLRIGSKPLIPLSRLK